MTFYFIDFENISDKVFSVLNIPASDSIQTFLFYRPTSAHTIDIRTVKHLKVDMIECDGDKDQLVDNILCSTLGFFIAKNEHEKNMSYIVVAEDKGYEQVCKHWKTLGYDVSYRHITEAEKTKQPALKKKTPVKKRLSKKERISEIFQNHGLPQKRADELAAKIGRHRQIRIVNNIIMQETKDGDFTSAVLKDIKKLFTENQ